MDGMSNRIRGMSAAALVEVSEVLIRDGVDSEILGALH
jgi:hypothetical protein